MSRIACYTVAEALILISHGSENCTARLPGFSSTRMVGCFGLNGPLRQYFSLYRAVSQRRGQKRKRRVKIADSLRNLHCFFFLSLKTAISLFSGVYLP